MADTTIEAILRLKDQLSGPLRGVGSSLNATAKQIGDINSAIRETAASALGMKGQIASALGAIGVGIGFKEILDLSSNFEDTALSIAGNIKAFDLAPTFDKAREAATGALETIDAMAAKLPGEADQYIQVFKTALPKAIESGLGSVKEVADFTSKYTAVAVSNQIDAMQAGMDLMRLLGGQAGLDVRTWQTINPHLKMTKDLMKELGSKAKGVAEGASLSAEMFNKLSIGTRRKLIEDVIGKFDQQLTAAGDTFSAKMGEITSRVKKIIRIASTPMFEGAKNALTKINEYLEKNGDKLRDTLNEMFQKIAEYLPKVVDLLKFALDHAEGIKNAMVIAAGAWATSNIISTLTGALGLAQKIGAALGVSGVAGGAAGTVAGYFPHIAALTAGAAAGYYGMEALSGYADRQKMQRYGYRDDTELMRHEQEVERLRGEGKLHYWQLEAAAAANIKDELAQAREIHAQAESYRAAMRAIGDDRTPFQRWNEQMLTKRAKTPDGRSKPPNYDFRNSRFDIKQMFSEGFDPDRIAVAFASDLARAGEMKLQAARNIQSGFVR